MRAASVRFLFTLGLVSVLAGCGEREDVSPSFEDRIPVGLELEVSDRLITWGGRTDLTGVVEQGKDTLAGETVTLEGDGFPLEGSFEALETGTTDEAGRFGFEVEPSSNTAYRVSFGELSEAQSNEQVIFVEPRTEIVAEAVGERTIYETRFRHPKERSIQGSTVYSYAATVDDAEATGKLNFLRVERVMQDGPGRSSASIVLPFSESEVTYGTCIGYTPDAGMGDPQSRCSQSDLSVRR